MRVNCEKINKEVGIGVATAAGAIKHARAKINYLYHDNKNLNERQWQAVLELQSIITSIELNEQPDEQPEPPEQKPELTPEQAEQRKQRVLTAVFAVVIVAASLVFAAFGVQHVEVLLALCFCMYLGMRYRLAAFGFAVLAVRRLYDAIALLMQGGHLLEALTDGCICVIFITLTLHMLRTYANSKNQADADETE